MIIIYFGGFMGFIVRGGGWDGGERVGGVKILMSGLILYNIWLE